MRLQVAAACGLGEALVPAVKHFTLLHYLLPHSSEGEAHHPWMLLSLLVGLRRLAHPPTHGGQQEGRGCNEVQRERWKKGRWRSVTARWKRELVRRTTDDRHETRGEVRKTLRSVRTWLAGSGWLRTLISSRLAGWHFGLFSASRPASHPSLSPLMGVHRRRRGCECSVL
jgi:hypothetical protein